MKRWAKKCRASKVAEDELGRIVVFYEFCEVYFFLWSSYEGGTFGLLFFWGGRQVVQHRFLFGIWSSVIFISVIRGATERWGLFSGRPWAMRWGGVRSLCVRMK